MNKKKRLRKRSNNPRKKMLLVADNMLQSFYRDKFPGKKCEGCGEQFELMHHFVLKSHSNTLRYHPKNLIFLCKKCHSMVHGFHGEIINAEILFKRGKMWLEEIRQLEKKHESLPIYKIQDIIKKLENEHNIPTKKSRKKRKDIFAFQDPNDDY